MPAGSYTRALSYMAASLLLVVVTTASSILLYQFISNAHGLSAQQSRDAGFPMINIEDVRAYRGHIVLIARNMGERPYTIDRVYVLRPDGTLASTGTPSSPTSDVEIPPRQVRAIIFYTGVLPDGTYRIKITGHGSPTEQISTPLMTLKLSSGPPPIMVTEFYPGYEKLESPIIRLNSPGVEVASWPRKVVVPLAIELYNPTSAPINITKYVVEIYDYNMSDSSLIKKISFRIISYDPPRAYFYSSSLCLRKVIPPSIVINPGGRLVLNFTQSCITIYNGGGEPNNPQMVKQELRILYKGTPIDETGNFTFWININGTYIQDLNDTAQRVGYGSNTHWILAPQTLGQPNKKTGKNADA